MDQVLPPEQSALVALYKHLEETTAAHYSYAGMLVIAYEEAEKGTFPRMRPSSTHPREPILRTIHVAIATEAFKAIELLGALCLSASKPDHQKWRVMLDFRNSDIDAFFETITPELPIATVREWFPYPDPEALDATRQEKAAIREFINSNLKHAKAILLFLKEQREYLKKFRHKFSHSYAFMLAGMPEPGAQLNVPVLKPPQPSEDDRRLRILDAILLPSQENNQRLLGVIEMALQVMRDILHARAFQYANSGSPVLPHAALLPPGVSIDQQTSRTYQAVLERQPYMGSRFNFRMSVEPNPEIITAAREFYARVWWENLAP